MSKYTEELKKEIVLEHKIKHYGARVLQRKYGECLPKKIYGLSSGRREKETAAEKRQKKVEAVIPVCQEVHFITPKRIRNRISTKKSGNLSSRFIMRIKAVMAIEGLL